MLLRMNDIVKQYPGVRALSGVSFDLRGGEVHCLVGENGAGKSTLMKILSGAIPPDGGTILLDDEPVSINDPATAQRYGIGTIYQDAKQVPELTVADNIFLGSEPTHKILPFVDEDRLYEDARTILGRIGESIPPREILKNLTVAQRQIVEVAKAIRQQVRILIFDEPTASLSERETENLFRLISELKTSGVGIIYISHRLEEIKRIADRVTILRDGLSVACANAADVTMPQMIQWMVGRELSEEFPPIARHRGEEILRVEHVSNHRLRDVSFVLHRGEILGVAGLVGAGRTELARALFAADPIHSGKVFLYGNEIMPRSPEEAIRAGVGLLTEDRNGQGLFLHRNVAENITISSLRSLESRGLLDLPLEEQRVKGFVDSLHIKPPVTALSVDALSGGNRQKVVLARWLATRSSLLIFDEPTVGIDVGVKYEFYVLMNELVRQGIGIIMISSDLNEILGVCDRIAVMCDGRISGFLKRAEATTERIMELATSFN